MSPGHDEDETPPDHGAAGALSRRRVVGGAVIAGAVTWAAPTLLTVQAAAAQSQPSGPPGPPPQLQYYHGQSWGQTTSTSIDLQNLTAPGVLIGGTAYRGTATAAVNTTFSGNGWQPVGFGDAGAAGGMVVWGQAWDPSIAGTTAVLEVDYTFPVAATAFLLFYPTATAWEPVGVTPYATGTSTTIQANPIATTGANRTVVWVGAWADQNGTPMPTGFTNRGNTTSQLISLIVGDRTESAANPSVIDPGAAIPNSVLWFGGMVAVYA